MRFVLNKNITRRRRLEKGDGSTEGDDGTFGYNMRSGMCIKKDEKDTSCGDEGKTTPTPEGEFALLFSLLALFALY